MLNTVAEKSLARLLMAGSAFISIFVVWGAVTDPVNVTKLLALGGVAGAAITLAVSFGTREMWTNHKLAIVFALIFALSVVNSVVQSSAPMSQLIYGAYGRNTGLVTYFLLIVLFISTLSLSQKTSFLKISYGLLAAGIVNAIYSLWVITFGDFIGWTNPYGNILGTFGNPNFIGAFLGMFASVLFAFAIKPNLNWKIRICALALLLVTFVEIKSSSAIQGIVVAAGGMALVGFFFLRSRFSSPLIPSVYSLLVLIGGVVATLGALQKGPLTSLIYKNSVSLRGEYWQAGWNMAKKFPWSGVGMDTYGDWYRRLRDDQALINPGPNTISNAAHNVVLDQLAYGGWPMFIAYLAIIVLVAIAIIKVVLRDKSFDFTFIGLAVAWICYQVQSIISINQIGLAIWGWLLGGALVAYERATRISDSKDSANQGAAGSVKSKSSKQSVGLSPFMVGTLGAVIGLLIAVPPYSSDTKWKAALSSGSVEQIEKALTPGYLNPQGSYRYASATQLFEANKLYDQAYKYAKIGVEFNPEFFDAWKMLYYIQKSTPEERELAKKNLLRIDPMNKNIFDVPQQ
jgi:O-antigen ligase